jgi:hypothetical protein
MYRVIAYVACGRDTPLSSSDDINPPVDLNRVKLRITEGVRIFSFACFCRRFRTNFWSLTFCTRGVKSCRREVGVRTKGCRKADGAAATHSTIGL